MNIDAQIAEGINQLTQEDSWYIRKLIFLLRSCPGFSEEVEQIAPQIAEVASDAQVNAISALMDNWLYKEGWAEKLRSKLGDMGVPV